MPYAVTHFLIPAILVALFRDFYLRKKQKRNFPLHYVLIAGLAGLIPDLDYVIQFIFQTSQHRIFFHNLFLPAIFLILGFVFYKTKNSELGKHKLKLATIFFIILFSTSMHLTLDATIQGAIFPFYPFSTFSIGINAIQYLPDIMQDSIIPVIDAVLLIFWMIYIEIKHKISDFI